MTASNVQRAERAAKGRGVPGIFLGFLRFVLLGSALNLRLIHNLHVQASQLGKQCIQVFGIQTPTLKPSGRTRTFASGPRGSRS